jgi:hypothetical protein
VKLVGTVPKGLRKIILSEEMGIEDEDGNRRLQQKKKKKKKKFISDSEISISSVFEIVSFSISLQVSSILTRFAEETTQ